MSQMQFKFGILLPTQIPFNILVKTAETGQVRELSANDMQGQHGVLGFQVKQSREDKLHMEGCSPNLCHSDLQINIYCFEKVSHFQNLINLLGFHLCRVPYGL